MVIERVRRIGSKRADVTDFMRKAVDLPVLYSFRRCPYAMRARLAIAVSHASVALREVVLKDKPQALLDISPKATVPVLVTRDGRIIDESLDIMRWALQQSDPESWLTAFDHSLISHNDGEFKYWLDRYKYADRYPDEPELFYRQQGENTLLMLEQRLVGSAYLSGDNRGITDIAIFPFIRQFAAVDLVWFETAPYPKLRAWLKILVGSIFFQKTMVKYKQWKPDGVLVVFPEER